MLYDFPMLDTDFHALVDAVSGAATANLNAGLAPMAGSRDAVVLALVSAGICPASSYETAS